MHLYIKEIQLESSTSCEDDSLKVYDGANDTTLLLDKLCGSPGRKQYVSSTGRLYIRFRSNGKSRFRAHLIYTYRGQLFIMRCFHFFSKVSLYH